MVVTLCVGGIYNTLAGFKESKDEAMVTKWNRMDVGRGNVMYSNLVEFHPDYAEKMKQLFADMYRAVDIANYTQFDRAVTTLFMLPRIALARYRFREGISQFLVYFIHEDQRIFSEYFEIEKLASQIDDELDHQSTLKKFENCFRRWAQILFEKLESTSGMQDAMLIRKAKQYVRDHYDGHINIQTVADQVGLSAVYFSHLYKIKTGENFTEYVCAYRIEKGKELLRDSELNVNEIAAAAGFSDPRYFSRKFKEAVGVTPSQFRKISDAKK